MRRVLATLTACGMLSTAHVLRLTPSSSYDRVVLVLGLLLQFSLLASLCTPIGDVVKSHVASFSHFGFVASLVYGAVAASRPTLLLVGVLLCVTLVSRILLKGCMYSIAEDPSRTTVCERPSWDSDWQLLGVFALSMIRLSLRWTPTRNVQAVFALLSSAGAAYALA